MQDFYDTSNSNVPDDSPIFKIDFHSHIIPKSVPDFGTRYGYGGFAVVDHDQSKVTHPGNARLLLNGKLIYELTPNFWDLSVRLDEMNRDNINIQVLSALPCFFNYWAKADDTADLCRILNNDLHKEISQIHSMNENEGKIRFMGLGTVPLQAPELAVKELERCVVDLGFVGVQIGSHVNDWNLDAMELAVFWQACEDLDVPVFVHPCDVDVSARRDRVFDMPDIVGMSYETTKAITCVLLGGVLDRFPKLKICFAHGGGAFPYIQNRIQQGYNTRPVKCGNNCDVKPKKLYHRIYCDSVVGDPRSLKLLVDIVGEDHVLFGVGYPLDLGETLACVKGMYPGKSVDECEDIGSKAKAEIFGINALRFLGKTPEDFL